MAKLASITYGEALYELALEENKIDQIYEEVVALQKILQENPSFTALMNHPKVTKEQKEQAIKDVFEGRLSGEMTGFLLLLLKKDRYSELNAVLVHFVSRIKEYKGIGVAMISSAVELSEARREQIRKKLLETTSYHEMEIHYTVDPSLIGGMIIRIGDKVVDSSIRTKLEELKRELQNVEVA